MIDTSLCMRRSIVRVMVFDPKNALQYYGMFRVGDFLPDFPY